MITENGFIIIRSEQIELSRNKVEQFYEEHKGFNIRKIITK